MPNKALYKRGENCLRGCGKAFELRSQIGPGCEDLKLRNWKVLKEPFLVSFESPSARDVAEASLSCGLRRSKTTSADIIVSTNHPPFHNKCFLIKEITSILRTRRLNSHLNKTVLCRTGRKSDSQLILVKPPGALPEDPIRSQPRVSPPFSGYPLSWYLLDKCR